MLTSFLGTSSSLSVSEASPLIIIGLFISSLTWRSYKTTVKLSRSAGSTNNWQRVLACIWLVLLKSRSGGTFKLFQLSKRKISKYIFVTIFKNFRRYISKIITITNDKRDLAMETKNNTCLVPSLDITIFIGVSSINKYIWLNITF